MSQPTPNRLQCPSCGVWSMPYLQWGLVDNWPVGAMTPTSGLNVPQQSFFRTSFSNLYADYSHSGCGPPSEEVSNILAPPADLFSAPLVYSVNPSPPSNAFTHTSVLPDGDAGSNFGDTRLLHAIELGPYSEMLDYYTNLRVLGLDSIPDKMKFVICARMKRVSWDDIVTGYSSRWGSTTKGSLQMRLRRLKLKRPAVAKLLSGKEHELLELYNGQIEA